MVFMASLDSLSLPRSSGAGVKPVASPVAWIGMVELFWSVFMWVGCWSGADTTRPDGVCALLVQGLKVVTRRSGRPASRPGNSMREAIGPGCRRRERSNVRGMIGEAEPAQFLGTELAFGRAVNVTTVAVIGLTAGDRPLDRPVKRGRFVAPMMIRREARHRAVIPKSFKAQEGLAASDPALWRGKRSEQRRPSVPAGTPASRHFAEEPADRVHVEGRPA